LPNLQKFGIRDFKIGLNMKFCYVDESGTGDEPFAVMVGVLVDAQRMHVTKGAWQDLLRLLSEICCKEVTEFHTRDFYKGNGVWRTISGDIPIFRCRGRRG
jgi:hypothetical protein